MTDKHVYYCWHRMICNIEKEKSFNFFKDLIENPNNLKPENFLIAISAIGNVIDAFLSIENAKMPTTVNYFFNCC